MGLRGWAGAALAIVAAAVVYGVYAPDFAGRGWREGALPLSEGLLAYARGDYAAAEAQLTAALSQILTIGGSHAQRDLFEQLRVDAVMRNGDWAVAQQLLEQRRASDRSGAPVNRALAAVYAALDLPAEAAKAEGRVQHTLAAHAAKSRMPA